MKTLVGILTGLAMAAIGVIGVSQTITTVDQTIPVVVPGQTFEIPPHNHDDDYAAKDHEHADPNAIPTAEELSKPGELQEYIVRTIARTGGFVQLPPGRIDGNAFIDKDSVTLAGMACPYGERLRGTIIVPADPTQPGVTVRDACRVALRDFGVLGGDVGVSFEGSVGALAINNSATDVAVCKARVGIRFSEPPGTRKGQHCAADTVVSHCQFELVERAIELNHPQSVNILIDRQSYGYSVDYFVWVNAGGRVTLRDCCANPINKAWLRVLSGGGNQMPYVLDNLYTDRTGGTKEKPVPIPVLVDARGVEGTFIVDVDNYSCSYQAALDGPYSQVSHKHFVGPTAAYAKSAAVWNVEVKTFNAPGSIKP